MREEREKKKRRKSGRWWRYFQQAVLSFQRLFFARRGEGRGDCSFLDLPSSYFFQYVLSFSNLSPRLLTPSSSYPFYVSYVKSSTFQLDVFNSFLFSSSSFPSPCSSPCSSSFFLPLFHIIVLERGRNDPGNAPRHAAEFPFFSFAIFFPDVWKRNDLMHRTMAYRWRTPSQIIIRVNPFDGTVRLFRYFHDSLFLPFFLFLISKGLEINDGIKWEF